MKNIIIKIITFLNLNFDITQCRLFRKMFGGKWFLIDPSQLKMGCFWSNEEIASCQSKVLLTEQY